MDKDELRKSLKKVISGITGQHREQMSKMACKNLASTRAFQKASGVMFYLSLPHEVDTTEAMLEAWQQEKTVVVPRILWHQGHMIPVQISTLEKDLTTVHSGLRNPVKGFPVPYEDIDLVIVPGLGFDDKGNRIGRGEGYYDSFFTHNDLKALRCGFAFEQQRVQSVPVTDNDQPIDFLVTEQNIIYFNSEAER